MSRNRDAKGRFTKGHSGGPGRPSRATETEYLQVVVETISLNDFREIVFRAKEDAKKGSSVARQWISDYLLGKPGVNVSVAGKIEATLPPQIPVQSEDPDRIARILHILSQAGAIGPEDIDFIANGDDESGR